jgi:hypothetical protein
MDLGKYYDSVNEYKSGLDGGINYLNNYQQGLENDFNEKIAHVREKGRALVEVGGLGTVVYGGAQSLYKKITSKKPTDDKPDEDKDEEEEEDDEEAEEPEAPEAPAPAPNSTTSLGLVEDEPGDEGELDPFQPGAGNPISSSFTPNEATNVADTVVDTSTSIGEDVGTGVLDALAVGSEAIPFVGGAVALGMGIYDLFKMFKKPSVQQNNTSTLTSGQLTVPSFDSVNDSSPSSTSF